MFHGSTAKNQHKCKTPSPCIMQITLHIAKFNNIIFIVLIVKFNLVLNFFIEFWELPYLASDLFQAGKKRTVVTYRKVASNNASHFVAHLVYNHTQKPDLLIRNSSRL